MGDSVGEDSTSIASVQDAALPVNRAMLFYKRARRMAAIGKGTSLELERQLRELYKALSYKSEDVQIFLMLGKTYKQNLDISSAMICYRYVLRIDSGNQIAAKMLVELLTLRGKELMIIGHEMKWKSKFVSARCCFDEAIELNRENFELWTLKSICHIQCEELTEAYEAISKVLRPNRDLPAELYILRAKINWGRGLVEQGNQDIRVAASMVPDHPEVISYINRSYAKSESLYHACIESFKQKDYKHALEHVDHAIFLTGEDVKLHLMRSKTLRMLKDLQSAYESVLKAKALFEEKYQEGEHQLQLPQDISTQISLILNEMALDFAQQGRYDKAVLLFNKIIRGENTDNQLVDMPTSNNLSGNHKFLVNRGDCYRAMDRLSDAVADYEQALRIQPTDWEIRTRLSVTHYLSATALFNEAKYFDADASLTKAIEQNPKVSEYFLLRGKTRYYLARFFEATADFRKALELNPSSSEARQRLQQFEDVSSDAPAVVKSSSDNQKSGSRKAVGQRGTRTRQNPNSDEQPAKRSSSAQSSSAKHAQESAVVEDASLLLRRSISQYKTDRSVARVSVEDQDLISMMLHPQQAQHLPTLRMLTTEAQEQIDDRRHASRRREARQRHDRIESQQLSRTVEHARTMELELQQSIGKAEARALPPQLLPRIHATLRDSLDKEQELQKSPFYKAHIAARATKVRDVVVQHELQESPDITKGHMWSIVRAAKEIAQQKATAKLKRK